MKPHLPWLPAVTNAINTRTGIFVEDAAIDLGVGCGIEGWLHEVSHFVLLRGSLTTEKPLDEFWIGTHISDVKAEKGDRAGKDWGVRHELKTIAVELLVARVLGVEIDMKELALYAVENGNLAPRWRDYPQEGLFDARDIPERNWAQAKHVARVVRRKLGSPEVIEAAAFLSRAIQAERRVLTSRI